MSLARATTVGWAFPTHPRSDGRLPVAEGADKVAQCLRILLETEPGERLMRPAYGAGLRRFLMEPNTVATRALIEDAIRRAVARWEVRVALTSVRVEPGDDPATVLVHLAWEHVRDGRTGELTHELRTE